MFDRQAAGVDVGQFAAVHIVEMVVQAAIGVVKNACGVDDDFAHDTLFRKQAQGVVNSGLGNAVGN